MTESGIAIVDRSGRYLYINETLASYHGRNVQDYQHHHISEVIPSCIFSLVNPLYEYVSATGMPIRCIELDAVISETVGPLQWRASYVPIAGNILVTVSCLGRPQARSATAESKLCPLSPTETAVLALIAEGAGTKEIAQSLHLSPLTIATHRKHICKKLQVHSTAELASLAAAVRLHN